MKIPDRSTCRGRHVCVTMATILSLGTGIGEASLHPDDLPRPADHRVVRRDMHMVVDADVDFIFLDTTNTLILRASSPR
jgi:hypothetical protein